MNPLISVILPVYNGEEYLDAAIKSILSQTYTNFELIIVDDGSTDKSLSIAQKYNEIDKRIKIISNKENLQLPRSLNIGHNNSKGDYITWTSHDNILKPNFLKAFSNIINSKDFEVIYSNYDIIWADGQFKREQNPGPLNYLIFGNCIGASFIYKRKVFETIEGYKSNLFLVEDHDFFLRAALKFSFYHLEENLYQYRLHQSSLTSRIQNKLDFSVKLKTGLERMYDELDINLHSSSRNFIIELYFKKPVIDIYIKKKQEIRNDLKLFENILKEDVNNSIFDHLEDLLRLNWLNNNENQSLKTLVRVMFKAPELLFGNYHNKNFSLKIIFLSLKKKNH